MKYLRTLRVVILLHILSLCIYASAQSVNTLNSYLSTYSYGIRVSNPYSPNSNSCIYETNYVKTELQDNILIIYFGFGWDKERGYIDKDVIRVDLSTATFCTGFWYKSSNKREHYGEKDVVSITDNNGMDISMIGQQNYNQGTRQSIISKICFKFSSEPIANKVINEIYSIQSKYKSKEPWLIPISNNDSRNNASITKEKRRTNSNNTRKAKHTATKINKVTSKQLGKYVQ